MDETTTETVVENVVENVVEEKKLEYITKKLYETSGWEQQVNCSLYTNDKRDWWSVTESLSVKVGDKTRYVTKSLKFRTKWDDKNTLFYEFTESERVETLTVEKKTGKKIKHTDEWSETVGEKEVLDRFEKGDETLCRFKYLLEDFISSQQRADREYLYG